MVLTSRVVLVTAGLLLVGSCGGSGPAPLPWLAEELPLRAASRSGPRTCLADVDFDASPLELPQTLEATGCFPSGPGAPPSADLVPYDVVSPLWTDGAYKLRFISLPDGQRLEMTADGPLELPRGGAVVKVFGFETEPGDPSSRVPVEVRVIARGPDGYEFFTYVLPPVGGTGQRLDDGYLGDATFEVRGEPVSFRYQVPNRESCTFCHGPTSGSLLGLSREQLDKVSEYDDGRAEAQLTHLEAAGILEGPVPPSTAPPFASPSDESASLDTRARAYLEANCAHCHHPAGWAFGSVNLDLRASTPFEETQLCEVGIGSFGPAGSVRLRPGRPDESRLLQRMEGDGPERMPPFASFQHDVLGETLIRDWIAAMNGCGGL